MVPVGQVRLIHKGVDDLTPDEYRKLHRLNLGDRGAMRETLVYLAEENSGEVVFLIDQTGAVISWALLFEEGSKRYTYFYTRVKERQKGFGTQIARYIEYNIDKDVYVCPHDPRSRMFFATLNFKSDWLPS